MKRPYGGELAKEVQPFVVVAIFVGLKLGEVEMNDARKKSGMLTEHLGHARELSSNPPLARDVTGNWMQARVGMRIHREDDIVG